MADFNRPESEEDFKKNFGSIKPAMSDTQAHYESARCLFCYDAPCIQACPTGIDIPLFIRQIHTNNLSGAASTIYQSNWLGYACGQVCPTEVLCEGACVYNHQEVKPIEIGRLQSYATRHVIRDSRKIITTEKRTGYSVAIVGAGPAGIAAACELSVYGHKVIIFEAKSRPSGLVVHGVAPYKITNEQALDEVHYLQQQFGFEIAYEHPIATASDFDELENNYHAVFLGIGLGDTRNLNLKGEHLEGCWGAVEFIEHLKIRQHDFKVPDSVVVLGGGNTAMDAASECARMGAKSVTLGYRRGPGQMGAYEFEYELAKSVGVGGLWFANPIEILGETRVEAVKFERTQLTDGVLTPIEGSSFSVKCDMVIRATGQNKHQILSSISGLELEPDGSIKPGLLPYQCTNQKYFIAGDAYNGGLEVVNAVAEAKQAAQSINQYLSQELNQQV